MNELQIANKNFPIIELPGRPRVILDFHVAEIFEVETRRINEAVARNPEKFPDGFCFELTIDEARGLGDVANCDFVWRGGHLPKAFTWEGSTQ